jgi:UDP:flavonoid glycosyltransferase YjiC (YdhE family)
LNTSKNILICPLEWGLGHAARMIPLAKKLMDRNCRIFIGAGQKHLALFRAELKGITFIDFPGFNPQYSKYLPQYLAMLFRTPSLFFHIIREHSRLRQVIDEHKIDIVISDNRLGLWNRSITSVYVTHLPRIPFPGPLKIFEQAGILFHRWVIAKYNHCLIPDLPGNINLSGDLSHNLRLPANVRYTGIISRFETTDHNTGNFNFPHNTIILSGPEPQRSIFRRKILQALKDSEITTVVLEGRPDKDLSGRKDGNFLFFPHLPASEMKELLITSKFIVSRSGYTTIMDLVCLNRSALLVPTPGQTEQEYLAEYLAGKGWFITVTQKNITSNLQLSDRPPNFPDSIIKESSILLGHFLDELLEEKKEKGR